MRISDWSSDVCSSDLRAYIELSNDLRQRADKRFRVRGPSGCLIGDSQAVRGPANPRQRAFRQYPDDNACLRSEEHTSELQSLMRISYAVFCLKKTKLIAYMTLTQKKTQTNTSIQYTTPVYN